MSEDFSSYLRHEEHSHIRYLLAKYNHHQRATENVELAGDPIALN